ncbi:hypothetical protein, partial [Actinoallomurus sp. NPDC052274]|uniref:hypothetical protein n=1 Tax=Actinoallomurus sp. NPDC052274 TaxID=3155420 RepID=UPI003419A079
MVLLGFGMARPADRSMRDRPADRRGCREVPAGERLGTTWHPFVDGAQMQRLRVAVDAGRRAVD